MSNDERYEARLRRLGRVLYILSAAARSLLVGSGRPAAAAAEEDAVNDQEILARIAGVVTDRPDAAGVSCWMQVPGTARVVPLIAGPGPVTTWRIGRAGLDTGVTVGRLESALG